MNATVQMLITRPRSSWGVVVWIVVIPTAAMPTPPAPATNMATAVTA
jgi:hypothetical protein